MRRSKSAIVAAVAAFSLVAAASVSAGTLDQAQEEFEDAAIVTASTPVAQTFTAGLSGVLDQVDLVRIGEASCETGTVTAEIQAVTGEAPNGIKLGSATVSDPAATQNGQGLPFNFSTPPPVTAGTQYALVLTSGAPPACFDVAISDTDVYAPGTAFFGDVDVWTAQPDRDFAFRTYVAPAPPPVVPVVPARCSGRDATITGTEQGDVLVGTADADVIAGLSGKDTIQGLGDDDRICGGNGKDNLKGGAGLDRLKGGASGDRLDGGGASDTCVGGPGGDTARKCEVGRSL